MKRFAVTASLVLLLAGCSGQGPQPPVSPPSPAVSGVDEQYVTALSAIDPGLAENRQRAIDRGRNVCLDIKAGKDRGTVVRNAASRFDGGHVSVDAGKADRIVGVIESTGFCRG